MQKHYYLLFLILLPFFIVAQKNIESISSKDIVKEGVALYEEEKYDEAIKLFDKVSVNDTNYSTAQYEKALTYYAKKDYSASINVIDDLLKLNIYYDNKNFLYSLLGSAYDEKGEMETSIEKFSEGLALYPKSYILYYNRALVHTKMKNHKKAIEDYKKAIECKASHSSSHYKLGLYALHQGQFTEAMLSFATYLLIDPKSSRSNEVLQLMENASNGEFEQKPEDFKWEEPEDYKQLNVFFKNKVALEKAYKVKLTMEVSFGKQLHFLLSNLKYEKENEGFWNQTYVPILKEIYNEGKIDDLTLFCLQSSGSDKVQAKLKSKKSKLDAFITLASSKWGKHVNYKYVNFEGKFQQVYINYADAGLSSTGLVKNELPVGTWYYYYGNGSLKMKGYFSEAGKRTGVWEIYNPVNGNKSTSITFKEGEREGEELSFYQSGELEKRMTNKKGALEDTLFHYFASGDILEKYTLKEGVKDGDIKVFHENGSINFNYKYKEGKPTGLYQSFFPNNQLAVEFTLKEGLYEGLYTSYYENGTKKSEVNYINDLKDGVFREWFENGVLQVESNYKAGKTVGSLTNYYSNGVLQKQGVLDESGKENGITTEFDFDGKKYFEREFKKGELTAVKNYNKKGEVIFASTKKGKKIQYKSFYPDGLLRSEGAYENDIRSGEWKYYTSYGTLSAIEKYENGESVDTSKYFYNNGQLKSREVYVNGELNGIYLKYNIFGELILEGTFKDGEWDSDCYEYYNDGQLESEYFYVNGSVNGVLKNYGVNGHLVSWKKFENGDEVLSNFLDTNEQIIDIYKEFHGEVVLHDFSNSFIRYRAFYKNGKSNGKSTWYNPDGKINTEGEYINSKLNGKWSYYYIDGTLKKEVHYANGLLNGTYKSYSKNGVLTYSAVYKNDVAEGEIVEYFDNGKLSSTRSFFNDELHGKSTYYNIEGEVYMIRYYNDGIFKAYSYLGKDGKEVTPIDLKIGDNNIVTYYKNGQKASEHQRNNGLIEGYFVEYFTNGKVYSKELYKFGELDGESVYYFANGKIDNKATYYRGDLNGTSYYYHENGNLKTVKNFRLDELHGGYFNYDSNGKLTKTYLYNDGELIKIK